MTCCTKAETVGHELPINKLCLVHINNTSHDRLTNSDTQFVNSSQEILLAPGQLAVLDIWERFTIRFEGKNASLCHQMFYEFADMIVIVYDLECRNGLQLLKKNLVPEILYANKLHRQRLGSCFVSWKIEQ